MKDRKYPENYMNKIICGDCLELMKGIPDKSVDLVVTDPPYGINYLSNRYKYNNPHSKIINDDKLFIDIDECWRILKPTGSLFIFYSQKNPLVDKRIKNIIIWVKNNWSAGDLYGDFGNQYECIAFMPKEYFKLKNKRYSNVWQFKREIPKYHPTQKPVSIIERIIELSTNKNDLVFDPFLGSGTTAVACKELGRKYIGIEISPKYCEIAQKRVDSVSGLLF